MKTFYLLRHDDIHGNSGTGVVAQGVIFDSGMCAMTWLSNIATVTNFRCVQDVETLHGHEGRTVVVIEGRAKQQELFEECKRIVRDRKRIAKAKEEKEAA